MTSGDFTGGCRAIGREKCVIYLEKGCGRVMRDCVGVGDWRGGGRDTFIDLRFGARNAGMELGKW